MECGAIETKVPSFAPSFQKPFEVMISVARMGLTVLSELKDFGYAVGFVIGCHTY